MIAPGAEAIVNLRRKGMKPADIVIVSLAGRQEAKNVQVMPKEDSDYDWRWIKDLDICVFFRAENEWEDTVFRIKLEGPRRLIMWNLDTCDGKEVLIEPVEQIDPDSGATHPEYDDKGNIFLSGWRWEIRFNDLIDGREREFLQ